jgi:hypothetical protein
MKNIELLISRTVVHGQDSNWKLENQNLLMHNLEECNTAGVHVRFFLLWRCDPTRVMTSSFLKFLDHTQQRTTVGRIPLDEWSARSRDFYLTTHNTHNRKIYMPSVGFELTISAGERPQTYALDRAGTGTGILPIY